MIPVSRILEKLDNYLSAEDFISAERLLSYWLSEAEEEGDIRGKLAVLNEEIGLFRKIEKEAEGIRAIDAALSLCEKEGLSEEIAGGTTFVNAATAYKAFRRVEEALPLYEKAERIYDRRLEKTDARFGALYNNMALALAEAGRFDEAEAYFIKALEIMEKQPEGECEEAITYLNLADLYEAKLGPEAAAEKTEEYCRLAEALLLKDDLLRNGHYMYTLEKCAPVFEYYGFFGTAEELRERIGRGL